MVAWCNRCDRPVDFASGSWDAATERLFVRVWCHGEIGSARFTHAETLELRPAPRLAFFAPTAGAPRSP